MTLTPEQVHKQVFSPTRFRVGYDMAEVDSGLDDIEHSLAVWQDRIQVLTAHRDASRNGSTAPLAVDQPPLSTAALTADDIRTVTFSHVKFREGYTIEQVDVFMAEVAEALANLEAEVAALVDVNGPAAD